MFALYAILIFVVIHNVIRYVIGQQRYKFFHIVYFYVLVFLCIATRVVWFAQILQITYMYDDIDTDHKYLKKENVWIVDDVGSYLELLLGIQQIESMFEIYLMTR